MLSLGQRDGGKTTDASHRQLQSGGGASIEVVAIAFTGLIIGMIGYAVQARSAQKASQAQASLGREVAEREKAEAKAGKQLNRVQLQQAEWVRPFAVENQFVVIGWIAWIARVPAPRLPGNAGILHRDTPSPVASTSPGDAVLALTNWRTR